MGERGKPITGGRGEECGGKLTRGKAPWEVFTQGVVGLEISLNRAWQEGIFAFLILVGVSLGILGLYTFHTSPILLLDSEFPLPFRGPHLQRIEDINLSPAFPRRGRKGVRSVFLDLPGRVITWRSSGC